jgi:quercetin dioxygenase-like cupin family protein
VITPTDLHGIVQAAGEDQGIIWALVSDDLGVKMQLLHFTEGHGVADHPNDVSDVYWLGLVGAAIITLDGRDVTAQAGQVILLPRGASRSVRATSPELTYVIVRK